MEFDSELAPTHWYHRMHAGVPVVAKAMADNAITVRLHAVAQNDTPDFTGFIDLRCNYLLVWHGCCSFQRHPRVRSNIPADRARGSLSSLDALQVA